MDILLATVHWFSQPEHWFGDAGILLRLREHIYYVLISIAIASAIALPLGIALGYWRKGAFLIIYWPRYSLIRAYFAVHYFIWF